ncbi:DUF2069 domain-containing protein [Litorivicinus lipolyticus]|uniref:DUF2069 domain-containing protein n=1 Tax=Litorivicinus lipolyticus TaxID=418701 RepID=A0A5Q2Q929_9GAMM|nr:DUF2069 domain-containing protein [Litorivicinus lipolyticus]QGG80708.1 DUF2069 domain-containing protein [Litorivicinus lipolyticus]
MNKLNTALFLARISYLAILLALVAGAMTGSWKLAVIGMIPLLLVYAGPIKGDTKGNQWAAFAVTPYFMYGVTEQVENLMVPGVEPSLMPLVYWLGGATLFIAAMMHSRWQAELDAAD